VIDTLADGFRVLNRRPWLLVVPLFLDLFLWLGPEITADGLSASLVRRDPDFEGVAKAIADVNLLGIAAWRFSSAVGIVRLDDASGLDVGSGLGFAAVILGCVIAGLALFSVFYAGVAAALKPGEGGATFAATAWRGFLRLSAFWALMLGAAAIAMITVTVFALAGPVGEVFAGLFMLAAGVTALVAWLMFYMVQPAIFLGDRGARPAMRESAALVRANFGPTFRLFGLVLVITIGTGIAWQGIVESGAGALIAILGNAYIVTGLAVSVPLFYLDRRGRTAPAEAAN